MHRAAHGSGHATKVSQRAYGVAERGAWCACGWVQARIHRGGAHEEPAAADGADALLRADPRLPEVEIPQKVESTVTRSLGPLREVPWDVWNPPNNYFRICTLSSPPDFGSGEGV